VSHRASVSGIAKAAAARVARALRGSLRDRRRGVHFVFTTAPSLE
jgi:hypothetical protein